MVVTEICHHFVNGSCACEGSSEYLNGRQTLPVGRWHEQQQTAASITKMIAWILIVRFKHK